MNRRFIFALLQVTLSVVALAAVVIWALNQPAPDVPDDSSSLAWIGAAGLLYAVATIVRAERWHRILELVAVRSKRIDCYALTTVGYMGNNVLPARAGEMLRVVLLDARVENGGKRKLLGTIVAERILDILILGLLFVGVAYGVLSDRRLLPVHHPATIAALVLAVLVLAYVAYRVLRARGALIRLRELARPLAGAPRALLSRNGVLMLLVTALLWSLEGTVYLAVAKAVELDISASGALYLVALTNFVAALPAAPGSVGTFDLAVRFGAEALGGAGKVVLAYLILLRFVLYVPITLVGLLMMVLRYGGWARLRAAASLQTSRA